ncbi:MAG: Crp/Fnr family transcriptional regulator [Bacteroidales bacterium]|nr:Crp/Fnr family transcriptional regulator [Bacteroidales bacterium]
MMKLNCDDCSCFSKTFFPKLEKNDLFAFNEKKYCLKYKKGQAVFTQGTKPNGIYCLNKGKIKIFKTGNYGKEQITRFVVPGEILGIRSFFGERNYSSTAVALEDSQMCFISRTNFQAILDKYQNIFVEVIVQLSSMLDDANEKITSLAQKHVRERLAETLYNLNFLFKFEGKENQNTEITLSRQDLANIVGTATETIIRLLSEFNKEKLISIKGRKITILNPEGLYRIAN